MIRCMMYDRSLIQPRRDAIDCIPSHPCPAGITDNVSSLRDVLFAVCRIALPGFRPWRDVGDLRRARCVRISAEVEPPHCDGSTAFAAAEVLPRMQGIPQLTAFAAEWWGPPEGTGGGDGRRGGACRCRSLFPRRPSPPVPSGRPHHSAANAVSSGIPCLLGSAVVDIPLYLVNRKS